MASQPRSTFKRSAEYCTTFPRPPSPIAPAFEPLSPPRPVEPTFNYPALVDQRWVDQQKTPLSRSGTSSWSEQKTYHNSAAGPQSQSQSHGQKRKHHRTPSMIEELADAALATSPPYATFPRKSSLNNNGHESVTRPPPTTGYPHTYPQASPPTAQQSANRFSKRARSEVGPSPQTYPFGSRPSTSHIAANGWSYNLEQGIDKARRQSTSTAYSNPVEDAELLLNFAGRVAPRGTTFPSPGQDTASLAPSALPRTAHTDEVTDSQPIAHQPVFSESPVLTRSNVSAHRDASQATPAAAQVVASNGLPNKRGSASHPSQDPTASLPSPQNTNEEDEKSSKGRNESDPPSAPTDAKQDAVNLEELAQQQIHTPPEDDSVNKMEIDASLRLEPATSADDAPMDVSIETNNQEQVPQDEQQKKSRRGWPKGKPRGPRKSTGPTKVRNPTKRVRATASSARSEVGSALDSEISSAEDIISATRPRRKSESEVDLSNHTPYEHEVPSRSASVPPDCTYTILPTRQPKGGRKQSTKVTKETVCAGCACARESATGELDQWISCNGCKQWFHFDCAGFKNERDVRDVDKYFCEPCETTHGATTYVRKSTRAHTAVDYAGLNQGVLKTSDDNVEHHYIQPIKDGTLYNWDPEAFPRMRPELVTGEYFESCTSFSEPVLIPAEWNPRPWAKRADEDMTVHVAEGFMDAQDEAWMTQEYEYEPVPDDGQDKLDMVIPQDLTVRQVSELVGPDEPLEVIDVKTQGTEGKRWNLAKWADYYEAEGEKTVRNVISLEVSNTKLGRLLRRPKVVRQIDLQDSVWPEEETAKGIHPKVQFYCLMSVADSYTDFHIDFGGSSVYYHILRGKKTFFFIPPKPKYLKAYEDWNNSPEQNYTFLPNITKECYRVDLSEGDTMLIPSGWIHAVWTPANSLVIGGNFLTRMHYAMQLRIVDIEKATKVPLKFRYPYFQKVMWYTVIKYLETDPLPQSVAENFYRGNKFDREHPTWFSFREHGIFSDEGPENFHARYYSQAELDGLHDLVSFIFRTVMISLGRIEGVSEETRKKVVRSIPKSHGEPLDVARTFALWVAWKRGNEDPPAWAHPDAVLPENKEGVPSKKLSARALKEMQRQEAIEAWKIAGPDRVSARQQASREAQASSKGTASPAPSTLPQSLPQSLPQPLPQPIIMQASPSQYTSTPKTSVLGPKRIACDACRKRRIRCKHKDVVTTANVPGIAPPMMPKDASFNSLSSGGFNSAPRESFGMFAEKTPDKQRTELAAQPFGMAPNTPMVQSDGHGPAQIPGSALLADPSSKRGRSKACFECRKSKRRCIHDENGKIDPVKAEQTPIPRGSAPKKRKSTAEQDGSHVPVKKQRQESGPMSVNQFAPGVGHVPSPASHLQQVGRPYQSNMASSTPYDMPNYTEQWQNPYHYPDPTGDDNLTGGGPYHQGAEGQLPYAIPSLEQLANEVLESGYGEDEPSHEYPDPTAHFTGYTPYNQMSQATTNGDHMTVQSMSGNTATSQAPVHDAYAAPETTGHGMGQEAQTQSESLPSLRNEVAAAPMDSSSTSSQLYREARMNGVANTPGQLNSMDDDTSRESIPGTTSRQDQRSLMADPIGNEADAVDSLPEGQVHPTIAKYRSAQVAAGRVQGASPPASPLTDVPSSSPEMSESYLDGIPLYQPPVLTSQQKARNSKATESHINGTHGSPDASGIHKTSGPAPPTPNNKRKRDSMSATPGPGAKKSKDDGREKSAVEMEDDESLRLARELQSNEWGLRRRGSRG